MANFVHANFDFWKSQHIVNQGYRPRLSLIVIAFRSKFTEIAHIKRKFLKCLWSRYAIKNIFFGDNSVTPKMPCQILASDFWSTGRRGYQLALIGDCENFLWCNFRLKNPFLDFADYTAKQCSPLKKFPRKFFQFLEASGWNLSGNGGFWGQKIFVFCAKIF